MRPCIALVAGVISAMASIGPAVAAEEEEPHDTRYGASGDWMGLRDHLQESGWTFQIREKLEAADLVSGGRRLAVGAGETRLGATADLGKVAGLSGAKLQMTLTDRYGNSLGPSTGLDPLMPFVEVHGRGDIWRLTQFSLSQDLPGGLNLKLGRVNPGTDFDAFACDFENLTFCGAVPGNLVGDYWYNWPVSQWGARLKWSRGSLYAQAGLYQVNRTNLNQGFTLDTGGRGSLLPLEIGWTPKLGPGHLPGTWLLGGWYADISSPDLLLASDGRPQPLSSAPPLRRSGRYGGYLSITQQVSGAPGGRGVSLFLNATRADRRTSRLESQLAVGVSYKGPIPEREGDEVALAFGVTHLNGRAAEASRLEIPQSARLRNERVLELDYRLRALGGLTVTPDVQYVDDPGGRQGRHGTVLGLKTSLKF